MNAFGMNKMCIPHFYPGIDFTLHSIVTSQYYVKIFEFVYGLKYIVINNSIYIN